VISTSACHSEELSHAIHACKQCLTVQHSTALHSTAQHCTAQHSTAQHSTAQHSTAQHSMSLLHVSQTHMADKVMNMTICRARLSETVWWLDPYIPPVDRLYLIVA